LVRTAIIYKGKRKETQKDRQLVFKKANKDNKVAIEEGIRSELGKPTGELTKADLEKVRELYMPNDEITNLEALSGMTNLEQLSLWNNQITNLTPLAGLKGLKRLIIYDNPNLNQDPDQQAPAGVAKVQNHPQRQEVLNKSQSRSPAFVMPAAPLK
jgi:hypothetical protein